MHTFIDHIWMWYLMVRDVCMIDSSHIIYIITKFTNETRRSLDQHYFRRPHNLISPYHGKVLPFVFLISIYFEYYSITFELPHTISLFPSLFYVIRLITQSAKWLWKVIRSPSWLIIVYCICLFLFKNSFFKKQLNCGIFLFGRTLFWFVFIFQSYLMRSFIW